MAKIIVRTLLGILSILHNSNCQSIFGHGDIFPGISFNPHRDLIQSQFNISLREDPTTEDLINLFFDFVAPRGPDVHPICSNASEQYRNQLNNPAGILDGNGWALKMFDASAKLLPPGMMQGIFHFPGNFDSCLEVTAPEFTGKHCLLTTAVPGMISFSIPDRDENKRIHMRNPLIPPHYLAQIAKAGEDTKSPAALPAIAGILGAALIRLGRCVPSVCNNTDVEMGFRNFLEETLNSNEEIGEWFTPDVAETIALSCHTKDEKIVDLNAADYGMIVIIVIFGLLLAVGTLVDITINILHIDIFPEKVVQSFQGFSVYTNTLKLFNTEGGSSDSLDCINGIRFLSITWVLTGHAYMNFTTRIFINNRNTLYDPEGSFFGNWAFAPIFNAFPAVDTFFMIGATLLSYLTLKELDKNKGGSFKFWTMYFVHRYIRLTGLYAIVIGFNATLFKFFETGIQSNEVNYYTSGCQNAWWGNLLYINNLHWLVGDDKVFDCLGQAWYLANDMQFYLISPLIIYPLWKAPKVGLTIAGGLTVAATVVPTYLAWVNDWPFSSNLVTNFETLFDYFFEFYIVPWTRFQPYIVGLIFGYVLHTMRGQTKLKLNKIAVMWIWAIALTVGALVVYGLVPYQKDSSLCTTGACALQQATIAEKAFYSGFHRLAWPLFLCWVILACHKGAGGPINAILTWKAWVPLARMSYAIYLVHMSISGYLDSLASYTVTVSQVYCMYYVLFNLGVAIAVAYVCVVAFEAPIVQLEKLLYYGIGIGKLPAVRHVKME